MDQSRGLALKKGACLDMGGGATLHPSSPQLFFAPCLPGHSVEKVCQKKSPRLVLDQGGTTFHPYFPLLFFAKVIQPKGSCLWKKVKEYHAPPREEKLLRCIHWPVRQLLSLLIAYLTNLCTLLCICLCRCLCWWSTRSIEYSIEEEQLVHSTS